MKYSSSLLQKFISINETPQHIADNLTLKTAEIEHIQERQIPEKVVIGKVTDCGKHPEADKLSVCQVDCGKNGTYQILCGGANVAKGLYVPVALPGAHLPKIGITIEPRKMRGMDSNGMICSKEELGINEDMEKHNIWDLKEDFDDISDKDLGISLGKKYPRLEGYVLDVDNKSLTNRPDLTGHFGIATELNAIYGMAKAGTISFNNITKLHKQYRDSNILEILEQSKKGKKKVISEVDGLNSYILLELNDIKIQPSSFFTRLQMLDIEANPRSNRVDFSNLFMHISGQPVHFFDAAKIDGNIIVRNAKDKEEFVDLFGTKHILLKTDIVIADEKKILALAGVVGGLESGVTEDTKNILVEIANFDAVAVRKTGTRLALRTDAELRYEKNINPRWSLYCLLLFLDELKYYTKDLGTFEIGGLSYFVNKSLKTQKAIELHFTKMEEFIFGKKEKGFEKIAKEILEGLGFQLTAKLATPPARRSPDDMNIPEDIYEEVARIYGYDKIEAMPMKYEVQDVAYTPLVDLTRKLEDIMVRNLAAAQTESYPWIGEKILNLFQTDIQTLYSLQNPVNPEMPHLRDTMTYGLLHHIIRNHKFFDECKIFDIGKVRKKSGKVEGLKGATNGSPVRGKVKEKFANEFVNEQSELGIMFYQKDISKRSDDPLLQAKSMVNTLLKNLGLTGKVSFEKTTLGTFHPKKQGTLVYQVEKSKVGKSETKGQGPDGLYGPEDFKTVFGHIGTLHPLVLKAMKLPETAGVVSINIFMDQIIELLASAKEHVYTYETLQDQILSRDICFVVNSDQDFGGVLDAVKKIPEIKGVEVFDVYAGTNLGEGKKSVSIKIKIVGDGTMTTEQINEVMNKAIKAGEKEGGKLRSA